MLPGAWTGAFGLVFEAYTAQPLFGPVREGARAALSGPVAPGGTLLVIAFATEEANPERSPAMMPWPLMRAEVDLADGDLRSVSVELLPAGGSPLPHLPHCRAFPTGAEFHRS